ncbi:helix-turn-helix transcriptional regulator [uncultured Thiohalocapsa sp.]|uniref:helix-turn-helix domain-containing protein n=1 Tax=uncultured Thiohalocapsa sp. TaxID=768990 RepID=UPI0025CEC610|nr:helix-turn-helix transcriptional regulator [uncultured Thiohalocapsa sp.]
MKLTPFGECARLIRMKNGLSLKAMAEGMGVSSAYLSAVEFGEKRLLEKHIQSALSFLCGKVPTAQLHELQAAAEKSKDVVQMAHLAPDDRQLVSAFARRISDGESPPPELLKWLTERDVEG